MLGQHARAEAQARRTIERFPDSPQPYFVLGWSAWYQDRPEEAVATLEMAIGRSREAFSLCYLAHVYGRLGRSDEARSLLAELEQLRTRGQAPPVAFATIYAGLGRLRRRSTGSRRLIGSGTAICSGSPALPGSIPSARTPASPISSIA